MKLANCVVWCLLIGCLSFVHTAENGLNGEKREDHPLAHKEEAQTTEAVPNLLEILRAAEEPPPVTIIDSTIKSEDSRLNTPADDLTAEQVNDGNAELPEQVEEAHQEQRAVEEPKEEKLNSDEAVLEVEKVDVTQTIVNDTNNTFKVNDSNQGEGDIPSFNEWTQKVLEKEASGANGESSQQAVPPKNGAGQKLRQKNYASPDCGAKVIAANPEAEHSSHILVPSRDEYFLSPCSAKIWFIIELCEAIQAQRFEIANFELFSSSPKDFKVFTSDRYPTRDWMALGQFTAADERSVQSFNVEPKLFGKFVKVELVSHYGREHFCPISRFSVYGNSEYEVLEETFRPPDSTDEELLSGEFDQSPGVRRNNLLDSAKNVVINIVNKAAEVLGKGTPSDSAAPTNSTFEKNEDEVKPTKNSCHTAVKVINVTVAVNSSLSCQWNELNFLASLPWLHSALLTECPFKDDASFNREIKFAKSIWGNSTIEALCHWIVPKEVKELDTLILANETLKIENVTNETEICQQEVEQEAVDQLVPDVVEGIEGEQLVEKPVMQQQQKESILVQLTNRIKALEKNMSLSGQYLDELSRNYKKQVDDMQKSLNRTLQTLNDVLTKMTSQEERHEKRVAQLQGELDELKSVSKKLEEENFNLKTQVIESHLFLMVIEVALTALVVVYLLRRWRVTSQTPPSSPRPSVDVVQRLDSSLLTNTSHEQATTNHLTLNVSNLSDNKKQQASPTPSLAESSSSGCESAFSFAASARSTSREPSPVNENRAPVKQQAKKQKKKNNKSQEFLQKRSLSTGPIRLKSDNWEWHSRAKVLAAQFIKENYDANGTLRNSF